MRFRPGIAIDLGTVNTLVHVASRGIVVHEPSAVALETATRKVAAVGRFADDLAGKEPEGIEILWPLRDGVIFDLDAATLMLDGFLRGARVHRGFLRRSAVVCVPRGATFIERRAVGSTVEGCFPHCAVRLVEEPVAAASGSGNSIWSGKGTFVVDVGGGTTEVAVVAGGGVVRARSLRAGGVAMDEAISRVVKAELGLSLGLRAAERIKLAVGLTGGETGWAEVTGVDLAHGGIRSERIPGWLVAEALDHVVAAIVEAVQAVLSELPPDLADDVARGGIMLTGGGGLLLGLAARIDASTGIRTHLAEDPLRCVVRGAAEILAHGEGLGGPKAA
jgi:rod shape-determining protein MreB and related proteins